MSFATNAAALLFHMEASPLAARLRAVDPDLFDTDTAAMVLHEAARFFEDRWAAQDSSFDREGCRVEDGRVRISAVERQAWADFTAAGWLTLNLSADHGGQGLPLLVQTAFEELSNRASPSLSMLAAPTRTGAFLLSTHAPEDVQKEWLPKLASGEWNTTICMSEPDAGSDVGRVRTRAALDGETWRVTGEKCWISFGDHDLSERIGHLLLARTEDAPGVRGLSLFLVPDRLADGSRNQVFTRRIEEKLGLHGSPTCALGFEGSEATLIGQRGRGLQQLFDMVLRMRLSVNPQGCGVGAKVVDIAIAYAAERKQGGPADQPPVPIASHADVQRQLLSMAGRLEAIRGVGLAAAASLDLAERSPDADERTRMLALAQWLLPLAKDMAARTGFDLASDAVQVLGGAGYTREWPVEQALRDARVFSVFEGTTGMQAIDILHRRLWRERGEGLDVFMALAADTLTKAREEDAALLSPVLDRLKQTAAQLTGWQDAPQEADAGATHFLELASLAAAGWTALFLLTKTAEGPEARAVQAGARYFLTELDARSRQAAALALLGAERLALFSDLAASGAG